MLAAMDDTGNEANRDRCPAFPKKTCQYIPARWVVALMSFFGIFNMCSLRVNLSAAIVAMVDYEKLESVHMSSNYSESTARNESQNGDPGFGTKCENHGAFSGSSANASTLLSGRRLFAWDENMQGLVLGAYFYGYISAQIIGAWLGRRLGRVKVWGTSILIASLCTLLLPVSANLGLPMVVALRVATGFFSGVTFPLATGMMGAWAHPTERARFIAAQYAGMPSAMIVILPLSGYLANDFGWESVFYVTGSCAALWSCIWLALVHDSPSEHPRISEEEKNYTETALQPAGRKDLPTRRQAIPWLSMLTSIRYWSVAAAHCSSNFAILLFDILLPTYLKTILNFDIKASVALSSIPAIARLCLYPTGGWIADWIISKGVKTVYARKAFTALALVVPGAAMATAGYVGCNATVALLLFTISIGFDSFTIPGVKTTMVEIAPAFSGITYSVANTLSMTSGFTAPQIAGALRKSYRENPMQGWILLFWLAAIAEFAAATIFVIFASSDVQPWAKTKSTEEEKEQPMIRHDEEYL